MNSWLKNPVIQSSVTGSDKMLSWQPEGDTRIANKLRDIAASLDDEDAADAIEAIADEIEIDLKPRASLAHLHVDKPIKDAYKTEREDMRHCINELVMEFGWLIDDEELPNNDYDAPRKQTVVSRKIRKILEEHVHESYLPVCASWRQKCDEDYHR